MQDRARRTFDIAFSICMLILCLPLMGLIAVLVKVTSKGPILHKGLRAGLGGQLFTCWKFRTMHCDAKEKLGDLLSHYPDLRKEWQTYNKLRKDPRITGVGKFLRFFSLDELPQFWNVLLGDLSVVGPRPVEIYNPSNCRKELEERLEKGADLILSVKPGITGLWQTSGRNLLPAWRRLELEEEYVKTRSFLLDLKIICKTVYIVIFPKGAY